MTFELHFVNHGDKGLNEFLNEYGWDNAEQLIQMRHMPAKLVYNDYVWWVTKSVHFDYVDDFNEMQIVNHWEQIAIAIAAPKWENPSKFIPKRAIAYKVPTFAKKFGIDADFVMLDDEFTRIFCDETGMIPLPVELNPTKKGGESK